MIDPVAILVRIFQIEQHKRERPLGQGAMRAPEEIGGEETHLLIDGTLLTDWGRDAVRFEQLIDHFSNLIILKQSRLFHGNQAKCSTDGMVKPIGESVPLLL